jgi:branched-chain amino acid transport system permease protein
MSAAWQYYIIILLVYTGVNLIAVWALNLQFGLGRILNFGFIIFQAAGAYIAAVVSLGPAGNNGGVQKYILGANLPWPVPLLAGAVAGGALALVVGVVVMRVKRIDYQGVVYLTAAVLASVVITDYSGLFNGAAGLFNVPKPLAGSLNLSIVSYGWFYVALTATITLIVYFFVRRLSGSPWARQLRAVRENPRSAQSLGINPRSRRLQAFVVGGVIAGLSGALLVEFIGAWAPASWTVPESFYFLVAVLIGGSGNDEGVALGTVVVFTVILNGVQYLPIFSYTTLADALQFVVIGLGFIVFIVVRPRGLIPERPQRFGTRRRSAATAPASAVAKIEGGEVG